MKFYTRVLAIVTKHPDGSMSIDELSASDLVILQEDLKFLIATREGIAKSDYQEDRKALLKKLEALSK